MTRKIVGLTLVAALFATVAVFYFGSETSAQVKAPARVEKIKPEVRDIPRICPKPDLAQWKDNLPFGHKDEFPFSGECKKCFDKLGVMNLPTMGVWVANKGAADAPASKAKMTWQSGKAPFQQESITVNVPAIKAGEQHLLYITPPANSFFQTAKPVKLELDSAKQIDECDENNNTMKYNY